MVLSSEKSKIVKDIIENNKSFTFNQKNNKRQGACSHDRYEKYKSSKTYKEFLELGGDREDFRNDFEKGFIILDDIGDDDNGDNDDNDVIDVIDDNDDDEHNEAEVNIETITVDGEGIQFSELSYNMTKEISDEDKKNQGIYFTPKSILEINIDTILSHKKDIKQVLEPSCGTLEFITCLDKKVNNCEIDCVEYNKVIYDNIKNTKLNNNDINIINDDFIKIDLNKKYDLILGNPPYFNYIQKNIPKEYLEYISGRTNIYIIFILKCMDLLNVNGVLSFVLPNNFLSCNYYSGARDKIMREFNILSIIDHSNDKYINTEQKTSSFIIQKNPIYYNYINGLLTFNTLNNVTEIKRLRQNSTTLNDLGFKVSVGKEVWNEVKILLSDDDKETLLIYSSDISDNTFSMKKYNNPEKKNYIKKEGWIDPLLVVNRGYGKGDYTFSYCLIDMEKPYLIENHLICIKSIKNLKKNKLMDVYNNIIKSFNNPKTNEFIKLYFTNDAINCYELQNILPIYL